MATLVKPTKEKKDTSKVHKLSLKGSAKLVAEFVRPPPLRFFSRIPDKADRKCKVKES